MHQGFLFHLRLENRLLSVDGLRDAILVERSDALQINGEILLELGHEYLQLGSRQHLEIIQECLSIVQ